MECTVTTEYLVECSICYIPYDSQERKPKYLECHHFFCFTCITSLVGNKKIKCPMCRHDTRLRDKNLDVALRTNGDILQMKDVLEKGKFSSNHNKAAWCTACNQMAGSNCHLNRHAIKDITDLVHSLVGENISSLNACRDNWTTSYKERMSLQSLAMSMEASLMRLYHDLNTIMEHNAKKILEARREIASLDTTVQENAFHNVNWSRLVHQSEEEASSAEELTRKFQKLFDSSLSLSRTSSFTCGPETLISGHISFADELEEEQDDVFTSADGKRLIALMLGVLQVDSPSLVDLSEPDFDFGQNVPIRTDSRSGSLASNVPSDARPQPQGRPPPLPTSPKRNDNADAANLTPVNNSPSLWQPSPMPRTSFPGNPASQNLPTVRRPPPTPLGALPPNVGIVRPPPIPPKTPVDITAIPPIRPPLHIASGTHSIPRNPPPPHSGTFSKFDTSPLHSSSVPSTPPSASSLNGEGSPSRLLSSNSTNDDDYEQPNLTVPPRLPPAPSAEVQKSSCAWNPTSLIMAGTHLDGNVLHVEMVRRENQSEAKPVRNRLFHMEDPACTLSWSPNGMLLATGSENGSVRLWNREGQNLRTNRQHTNRVLVLRWNRRSTLLASGGLDRKIVIYDNQSKTNVLTMMDLDGPITNLEWQSSDTFSYTASGKSHIYLCKLNAENPIKTYSEHKGPITCMKWDSDGNFLVSGSADRTVKIWTTHGEASMPLQNHDNHKGGVNVVQWGPPGAKGNHLLASCSDDGTALLWDVKYGKVLHVLDGKKLRAFTAMSFSPNGKLIATGDQDGVVQIWSTKSGRCVDTYMHAKTAIDYLDWSCNTQWLGISVSNVGNMMIDIRKKKR